MAEIVLSDPDWASAVMLLCVVFIVLIVIGIAAARRPVLFRMGLRNASRRPGHTSLVMVGLMVGTAILSGAMCSGDTMEFTIIKEVYYGTDLIDEGVEISGAQTYNYSVYEAIAADPEVNRHTDGISPLIYLRGVTARDELSGQTEPSISMHGFDPALDRDFGKFETTDGSTIDGSDLVGNEAIINKRLAKALLAKEGHTIDIFFVPPISASGPGQNATGPPGSSIMVAQLQVKHIVNNEGKANYDNGRLIYINLGMAQALINGTGKINFIKVSNNGGIVDGAQGTKKTKRALENVIQGLGDGAGATPDQFTIISVKEEAVDIAESSSESFSDFLVMASSFTVAAGVMLIINIFVMLAEERKKELGISRAVGMRRGALIKAFIFEGVIYSLVASIIGAFLGLLIAYGLIYGIFSAVGGGSMTTLFYFKNSSLLMSFCWGFLITVGTVALASWRVSKLNIVRAIRSIDEPIMPKGTKKGMIGGAIMVVLGVLFAVTGYAPDGSGLMRILGPSMLFLGLALVLRRWIRMEVAYTFGGLAVLFYNLYFLLYGTTSDDEGMIALVIMGLFMVFGAVLALVSNSRGVVRGFGRALSFSPRAKAIVEPAIGHPLNKGFRTGMTISMFALVIFIVLLFSIFFTVFTPNLEDEGGGYHLAAYSSVPVRDIHNLSFAGNSTGGPMVNYTTLDTKVEYIDSMAEHGFWGNFYLGETEVPTYGAPYHSLFGIDTNFSSHVKYELQDRSGNYSSDREAWLAVANDPTLAIVDATTAGTHVPITVGSVVNLPHTAGGAPNKTYTVVGIADEILFLGLFVQKEGLINDFPQVRGNNFFLISVKEGEKHKMVAQQLEADFSLLGMNVIVLEEVLKEATKAIESIFQMFELFMSLGLVVGIASLGVLSVRAVIERRQEIGIMRAIGYRKSMVMTTFVLEMLFVTTMGVLIGVIIGWLGGYGIWKSGMEDLGVEFAVPWARIGLILLMTYVAAILCTILPAYKASRTRAAEAMREIE